MTLKRYRQMITKIACLCCLCMISCWYPIFRSLMICIFQELELCPGGLLIVNLPLSMRQLTVGAIITELLNTKLSFYLFCFQWHQPISLPCLLSSSPQFVYRPVSCQNIYLAIKIRITARTRKPGNQSAKVSVCFVFLYSNLH